MTKDDCFELGYILRPHGLKGELQIVLDTDDPEEYTDIQTVYIDLPTGLIPYRIVNLNLLADKAIAKLAGVDTVEQAGPLKGAALYLPLSELQELDEDQYYYHELVGASLYDETTETLVGEVAEVLEMPQQVMLLVHTGAHQAMVPLADDFFIRLDREANQLHLRIPEGLLDINA